MKDLQKIFLSALSKTIEDFVCKYKTFLPKLNNPEFPNKILLGIKEYTEALSESTRRSIFILANHGWFISLDMPPSPIFECTKSILNGDINNADKIMTEFFRSNSGEINRTLRSDFPNRSHVLGDAFNAHLRGIYNLSIPVFLIQTDGICNELIGIKMFSRKNNKPRTWYYANQFEHGSFLSALLEPFRACLPLTASKEERQTLTIENYLNRHEIIHGLSVGYGTEQNSLKAISLINFVSTVLQKAILGK